MNTETETTNTEEKAVTVQDIVMRQFAADDLQNAQAYVEKVINICSRENLEPVFNFDTTEELPAGYGLSVIPLTTRVPNKGNVTKGVCIAAVPSVESILASEGGSAWVVKQIGAILTRAVKVSAAPSDDGEITSIPFKINDFISSTRSSALAAFNAIASIYVKALKDKGLKFINKGLLRQVLSSAAFAEQQFPRIGQSNWELVLSSMKAHAAKDGLEAGILNHWIKTRDQIEVDTGEIDLSDIESIVSSDTPEETTQAVS